MRGEGVWGGLAVGQARGAPEGATAEVETASLSSTVASVGLQASPWFGPEGDLRGPLLGPRGMRLPAAGRNRRETVQQSVL